MYYNASELYNDYLEIYFDKYKALPMLKKELGNKYDPVNLFVETNNYVILFENEEQPDRIKSGEESTDLPPTLDGDQIKEGRKLKFLTPKKQFIRIPILLAQI